MQSTGGHSRRTLLAGAAASLALVADRGSTAPGPASDGFHVLEAVTCRSKAAAAECFAGTIPGPTLRARLGEEVRVRLVNRLEVPLSLHWQGVRIANVMDGVAGLTQPPVAPGASFEYRFKPPDSGTFLYRPVVPPLAGLHGILIVGEPEAPAVEREFVLAATLPGQDDRRGAETVTLPRGARVRVRAVNASQGAFLVLGVEGAHPSVVAIDSQPCEPFTPARNLIPIGPSARFDLMLDLPRTAAAVTRVTLRDALDRAAAVRTLIELRTSDTAVPERPAASLPRNPRLPDRIALERASRAHLILAQPPSGARGSKTPLRQASVALTPRPDAGKPFLSVRRGTPIALALANPSDRLVSVHVHGHAMRVLHDLDDGWHPYWRDTVLIEPRKTHHVAFVADNPGKWLVSAQPLGGGDAAAAGFGWFEVRA